MRHSKQVIVILLCLILTFSFCLQSIATLSEDTKYEETSDTLATEEEWAKETDISDLDLDPEEPKYITVCLNTDIIKMSGIQQPIAENETVYVPLRAFYEGADFTVKSNFFTGAVTVKNDDLEIKGRLLSKKVTVNGKSYDLNHSIIYRRGCLYAPADFLSVSLNAKVWYDELGKTFTVSTGKYKNDGVLRIANGKLYMDGAPYYEISFNKFDLCFQIHAKYFPGIYPSYEWPEEQFQYPAAEDAVSQLHSLGFRSIRVFVSSAGRALGMKNEADMEKYYQAMDDLFDLCDKYEIKMVVCMGLFSTDFCPNGENLIDLIGDLGSESFKNAEEYTRTFVERYKDRKSVLMWEIQNEGNLEADHTQISARQIGNFYARLVNAIHEVDPEHLVTGGDGSLRDSQWHMYTKKRTGEGNFWGRDTLPERFMAYKILYHGVDVVSMHPYSVGVQPNYFFVDEGVFEVKDVDFDYLAYEMKVFGKPLYAGEVAVNADKVPEENGVNERYLDSIIEAGIQLTHWWTFHADRQGFHDGYGWDITYGPLLDTIVAANKKIQERYCVNGCAGDSLENTDIAAKEIKAAAAFEAQSKISDVPVFIPLAIIVIAAALVIILTKVSKNKKNKQKESN